MKIKERLREMEFRKTELSDYLRISRPTLDKFIKEYDGGNKESVNPRVRKLFDYITENPLAGRKAVISCILSALTENANSAAVEGSEEFLKVRKYLSENPDSVKSRFIQLAVQKNDFDEVMEYLLKIAPFMRERRLTDEQIELLKPYDDIRNIIEKQTEEK